MGFWTNKQHRTVLDEAEDLGYGPSGGPLKMWLAGVGLALIPLFYGIHSIFTERARFIGRGGSCLDLEGSTALGLGIAYLAISAFIHFHYFWGLHPRLYGFSPILKFIAVLVFLGSFGYTIFRMIYEIHF